MSDPSQLAELESIVMYENAYQGFEYRFCVIDLSEDNIKNYCYCGKRMFLSSECGSKADVKNIMHFNIEDLANELAWYYY